MLTRSKRVVKPLIAVLGAMGASFLLVYKLKSQPLPPVTHPFVAHSIVRRFATAGDKGPVKINDTTYARKKDGSWADITTLESPAGEIGDLETFVDVISGREVTLEPFTKSAMTLFLTPRQIIGRVPLCPPDINSPTLEHDWILGYEVVKVTTQYSVVNARKMTNEEWMAPTLGCYSLRRSEVSSNGSHNEFETTDVIEGNPPSSMFEVPADYVERPPSELSAEYEARFGKKFWPNSTIMKNLDHRYYSLRGNQH